MDVLAVREQNEILRSAAEARATILRPVVIDRYLNPPPDTVYPLEYVYNLLGDVRGKTVLDFGYGSGENVIPSEVGANVIGIDISHRILLICRSVDRAEIRADLRVGVRRKTIRKRMRGKLRQLKQELQRHMHDPIAQTGRRLRSVVQGYFNYYAVPGNLDSRAAFRQRLLAQWWRRLRRRSQKHPFSWTRKRSECVDHW